VPGIGPSRAQAIQEAWTAQRRLREVMVFLQGYGVSPAFAARIYKRYGAAAVARVRENPFRLAFDVWASAFFPPIVCHGAGIARDSDARVQAGVAPRARPGGRAGPCVSAAQSPGGGGGKLLKWNPSWWKRR